MLKIAVLTPPMSNLNTPYSAAPRLTAWLRKQGHEVQQLDFNIDLHLRVYSRQGLERVFAATDPSRLTEEVEDIWANRARYVQVIDEVVKLLQGRDPAIAQRVVRGDFLPEGPFFRVERPSTRAARFGPWGKVDAARHMGTLLLLDLVGFIQQAVTPYYGMMEYGQSLATPRPSFGPIEAELTRPPNVVEEMLLELAAEQIAPDVDLVCVTCPFPGMLLGSLIVGKWLGEHRPRTKRALGGGYPSTELRHLTEPRVFDYIDYLVLDDGETPLESICRQAEGDLTAELHRTFTRVDDKVVFHERKDCPSPRFRDLPTPDYRGVDTSRYLHILVPGANSTTRLLNEGNWLKLTAAHGCYWKKCTFCDIHLPYIDEFDPLSAKELADQMDELHGQTGLSSFHFTDEAAPPPLLVNLSLELLRRGRTYQFWGNIRYDPGFSPDRCRLLAAAGMTAVTGGIEIASDHLLPKIAKGISVHQVTKVLQAFSGAGINTHAYLIYGFPGETPQDTIDGLEVLRQLMAHRLLRSGLYHLFSMTAHSPVGRKPELFGIRPVGPKFGGFAHYDLEYESVDVPAPRRQVLDTLSAVILKYSDGQGLDRDVREWFPRGEVPAPTVAPDLVARTMLEPHPSLSVTPRLCWLGGAPQWSRGLLRVSCADGQIYAAPASSDVAEHLARCQPGNWGAQAPRRADFPDGDWDAPFRTRGLVSV